MLLQLLLLVPLAGVVVLASRANPRAPRGAARALRRLRGQPAAAGAAGVAALWLLASGVRLSSPFGLDRPELLAEAGALAAAFGFTAGQLRRRNPGGDLLLFALPAVLSAAGWVLLASLGDGLAEFRNLEGFAKLSRRQALFAAAGVLAFATTARFARRGGLRRLLRLRFVLLLGAISLLGLAASIGVRRTYGAVVLPLPGYDFQPLEPARWLLVAFLAGFLGTEQADRARLQGGRMIAVLALLSMGILGVALGLGELGPAALLAATAAGLLALGTRSPLPLIPPAVLLPAATWFARTTGEPAILLRRLAESDAPFGVGGQLAESLWALAAGGAVGRSPARATAWRLPAVESDFAFAGWVELTGWVGGLLLLALFALLLRSLLRAAGGRRGSERLFVVGIALGLGAQTLALLLATEGYLPVTGVPVPFLSHSGLAMVSNWALMGLAFGVSGGQADVQRPAGVRALLAALLAGFAVAAVGLVARAVVEAPQLARTDFVSQARQDRLVRAANDHLLPASSPPTLAPGAAGPGVDDLRRMLRKGFVHRTDAGWAVDPACCRVRNPRAGRDVASLRGLLLDRDGDVLAESVAPERTPGGVRRYPAGAALAPVVGLHDPLLSRRDGAEALFDDALSARGRLDLFGQRPARGAEVRLTVDRQLSEMAFQLLATRDEGGETPTGRGAAVVFEPATGHILAAVSRPYLQPATWQHSSSTWRHVGDPLAWEQAGIALHRPRLDRALQQPLPPGSTFKLLVAASWLEAGHSPRDHVDCTGGRRLEPGLPRCRRHPARVDLAGAIAHSCNAWFGRAGVILGRALGATWGAFGLDAPPDLAAGRGDGPWLPAAARGIEPEPPVGAEWLLRGRVSRAAIGQDRVELTPLDVARLAGVFAARGKIVEPRLLHSLAGRESHGRARRLIRRRTADRVHAAAVGVLGYGTGQRLPVLTIEETGRIRLGGRGEHMTVAAKSGTADHGARGTVPHDWFVAWVRPDQPGVDRPLAVAVVVEEGARQRSAGIIALRLLAEALQPSEATAVAEEGAR